MGKVCLFSAIHGVVLDHGAPVTGATITRDYTWVWGNKKARDATTTNAQGAFALPAIWDQMWLGSFLPHEPFVEQTVLVEHAGQTYRAWLFTRGNYTDQGEVSGPIQLVCRLEAPEKHYGPTRQVYGICELR